MRFGAHVSAKGGIANAPAEAGKLGCSIFQCFLRPPLTGKPLLPASEKEVIEGVTGYYNEKLKQFQTFLN